jgi:hypothetical protein
MTEGEVQFSRRQAERYRLIVIYEIALGAESHRTLWHSGAVSKDSGFKLTPVQWVCELDSAPST